MNKLFIVFICCVVVFRCSIIQDASAKCQSCHMVLDALHNSSDTVTFSIHNECLNIMCPYRLFLCSIGYYNCMNIENSVRGYIDNLKYFEYRDDFCKKIGLCDDNMNIY